MKVTTEIASRLANDPLPQRSAGKTAFEQTLRSMEKDMWGGASAGRMPTAKFPSTRVHAQDSDSHTATSLKLFAPASACSGFGRIDVSQRHTNIANAAADALEPGAQPDGHQQATGDMLGVPLREANPTAQVVRSFTTVAQDLSTREATVVHSAAGINAIDARSVKPGSKPSVQPGSDSNPAYRVSVHAADSGALVAMRISSATPDEIRDISRKALAELRLHGVHDARIVVNGADQIIAKLKGEPHGH
ncbi:hypothetical protein PTKU46_74950 [Paraburkholderia terrae]|uniref:hypothetical protein n=1 Tax=Paraburkholderia terrae TaxID=311230 RepID=UPI0030E5F7E1